jgi:hypothetical protein
MIKRTERLQGSKNRRDDEYYTLYDDIAAEVHHYLPQLRGKGVVGNCRDDHKRLFTQDDKLRQLSEKTSDENGLYEC